MQFVARSRARPAPPRVSIRPSAQMSLSHSPHFAKAQAFMAASFGALDAGIVSGDSHMQARFPSERKALPLISPTMRVRAPDMMEPYHRTAPSSVPTARPTRLVAVSGEAAVTVVPESSDVGPAVRRSEDLRALPPDLQPRMDVSAVEDAVSSAADSVAEQAAEQAEAFAEALEAHETAGQSWMARNKGLLIAASVAVLGAGAIYAVATR